MGYNRKQQDRSKRKERDHKWNEYHDALKRPSSGPHVNKKDKRKSNKRNREDY